MKRWCLYTVQYILCNVLLSNIIAWGVEQNMHLVFVVLLRREDIAKVHDTVQLLCFSDNVSEVRKCNKAFLMGVGVIVIVSS